MNDPTQINISTTGGLAVVILAKDFGVPTEYQFHPQILPILAQDLPSTTPDVSRAIPSATKIVLIGGEIPAAKFGPLRTALNRRNLPYLHRRNIAALADAIRQCAPARTAPGEPFATIGDAIAAAPDASAPTNGTGAAEKPSQSPRGTIADFIKAEADLSKGSAEEARRLMKIAQQRGISTTVASLAQGIGVQKRKGGRTETPKSIMSAQQKALITLDEAIAGLQLIREYVESTEAQNLDYATKLGALRALLKD